MEQQLRVCVNRDLVQCPACKKLMWIYIFNDGKMDGIHKHNDKVEIPSPYIPLQANFGQGFKTQEITKQEEPDVPEFETFETREDRYDRDRF